VIFDNDPLFYADRLANSYRQLAMLHLSQGRSAAALDAFERMVDYAVAFDERPDTATYSSIAINRVTYDRAADTEARGVSKCARLLRGQFAARIWAPIRSDARFRAAVARLVACADAHADTVGDEA
jgi:hypothetical protein